MEIERYISWFDKNTERLVGEKDVSYLELQILKQIFKPPLEDPLMYNPYDINKSNCVEFTGLFEFNFEFDNYTYQLDCFQKEN